MSEQSDSESISCVQRLADTPPTVWKLVVSHGLCFISGYVIHYLVAHHE